MSMAVEYGWVRQGVKYGREGRRVQVGLARFGLGGV
jgi:hypothetical protein